MFNGDSPYLRTAYRPRWLGQAAGIPPGAVPVGPAVPPAPVSAPVGVAPAPTQTPAPLPAPVVVPSSVPTKLLLGGGIMLGSGLAWLGFSSAAKERNTGLKIAEYAIGTVGALKALGMRGLCWAGRRTASRRSICRAPAASGTNKTRCNS